MAYFSQEMKKDRVPACKKVLNKYGIKATFGVRHYSNFVCNIKSGKLDIIGNYRKVQEKRGHECGNGEYIQVNHYWIDENYDGEVRDFLKELYSAMNVGNHDNSNAMIDYFDVGFYIDINVGQWDTPYFVSN